MENKDNAVYLRHILDCVDKIQRYLQGFDLEMFRKNEEKVDAVVRNVEVIGEAANNLTREFRSANSQVQWMKIIGTRNRIVHGYATVDLEINWNITQNDLPILKSEVEGLLRETGN